MDSKDDEKIYTFQEKKCKCLQRENILFAIRILNSGINWKTAEKKDCNPEVLYSTKISLICSIKGKDNKNVQEIRDCIIYIFHVQKNTCEMTT